MSFSLFSNHLDLAHHYWTLLLREGDTVIDATCGNGKDSLFLANKIHSTGTLYLLDIQEAALERAKSKLRSQLSDLQMANIHFCHSCHSLFPEAITPSSVSLVVYNLGYLPGGDKSLTTKVETTLLSLQNALSFVKPGGGISITCYPGHPEGQKEEEEILKWAGELSANTWNCCHHRWINGRKAPSLLLLQRAL